MDDLKSAWTDNELFIGLNGQRCYASRKISREQRDLACSNEFQATLLNQSGHSLTATDCL